MAKNIFISQSSLNISGNSDISENIYPISEMICQKESIFPALGLPKWLKIEEHLWYYTINTYDT